MAFSEGHQFNQFSGIASGHALRHIVKCNKKALLAFRIGAKQACGKLPAVAVSASLPLIASRVIRKRASSKALLIAAFSPAPFLQDLKNRWIGASGVSENSFGHPCRRAADSLLFLNAICFAAQFFSRGRLLTWGLKDNAAISAGQWWRFITPAFLHGGVFHLAVNCWSLASVGSFVNRLTGHQRFLAIYAAGAVGGCVLSYLKSPAYSVGASGAIFGITGALTVFLVRHRKLLGGDVADSTLGNLAQVLAINFLLGMNKGIDNWGHLGGLIGGSLAAFLLGPSWQQRGGRLHDQPLIPIFAAKPKTQR